MFIKNVFYLIILTRYGHLINVREVETVWKRSFFYEVTIHVLLVTIDFYGFR